MLPLIAPAIISLAGSPLSRGAKVPALNPQSPLKGAAIVTGRGKDARPAGLSRLRGVSAGTLAPCGAGAVVRFVRLLRQCVALQRARPRDAVGRM
jgi:hypothetical protein